MVEEPMRNRLKAFLNRKHKIRWHRQTSHHILEDQSLVLQLLPLWHCKRWPHSCPHPCPTHTTSTSTTNTQTLSSYILWHFSFQTQKRLKNGPLRQRKAWDRDQPLSQPFGFALSVCHKLSVVFLSFCYVLVCLKVWVVWVCAVKGGAVTLWRNPKGQGLVSFYWLKHSSLCLLSIGIKVLC